MAYQKHLESGALATLAVRRRVTSRYFLFDEKMRLCGWRNAKTGEAKRASLKPETILEPETAFAFSGIHAISPAIFDWLPADEEAFSIIDVYLKAASTGQVFGYDHSADEWLDVGRPEALEVAAIFLKKNRNFA